MGAEVPTPADIIKWQNAIMKFKTPEGKPFKPTYLKTIQSELSALFNHAIRFYMERDLAEILRLNGEQERLWKAYEDWKGR